MDTRPSHVGRREKDQKETAGLFQAHELEMEAGGGEARQPVW